MALRLSYSRRGRDGDHRAGSSSAAAGSGRGDRAIGAAGVALARSGATGRPASRRRRGLDGGRSAAPGGSHVLGASSPSRSSRDRARGRSSSAVLAPTLPMRPDRLVGDVPQTGSRGPGPDRAVARAARGGAREQRAQRRSPSAAGSRANCMTFSRIRSRAPRSSSRRRLLAERERTMPKMRGGARTRQRARQGRPRRRPAGGRRAARRSAPRGRPARDAGRRIRTDMAPRGDAARRGQRPYAARRGGPRPLPRRAGGAHQRRSSRARRAPPSCCATGPIPPR